MWWQEHYPDNLKVTFMFPVSWVVHAVVSIGSAFLDPETRAKISLLREDQVLFRCFRDMTLL